MTITRRAVLPILTGAVGAVVGDLTRLVPESRLASLSASRLALGGRGRIRARPLLGRELQDRVDEMDALATSRAAIAFAHDSHWTVGYRGAVGTAVEWESGELIGTVTKLPVWDPVSGHDGKVVHADAGSKAISGLSLGSILDPNGVDVFKATGMSVTPSSRMRRLTDGRIIVEWADGHETVLPAMSISNTAISPGAKAGMAALLPSSARAPQAACQEICTQITSVSYVIVCTVESVIFCEAVCALFVPCSFICEAIMLVSCAQEAITYSDSVCTLTCA